MAVADSYCTLDDVQGRLYTGMGMAGDAPADARREALLADLIVQTSRDWDQEIEALIGAFSPRYESRLYSGRGFQFLDTEPFVAVDQIEYNSTPGRAPTWIDISSELTSNLAGALPLRGYPKGQLFRQNSWFTDPYFQGNVRVHAIFGTCQPDSRTPAPSAGWFGLDGPKIASLAPSDGGWWVTPDDVRTAVAQWVAYKYQDSRAVYQDQAGSTSAGGGLQYTGRVPVEVQRIMNHYRRANTPRFSLVNNDGSIPAGDPDYMRPARWAGWQASR